ncbi:type IV pilus modification PilV family protein [Marinimicrobium alkaliphilum]|uniref:type IV pilus modification PilV family protein n=1 Tax=Marinimicrobium alkaliphilum TaxID=2202654 RepID=UPI000DB98EDA|nr:prepilin-type N-terminal cleavage/methylation domain-containing protein [Marinimicrobium alkaliphilum]
MCTGSRRRQKGVTLVELIVFIVVVAVALGALVGVYTQAVTRSVDPLVQVRLLEMAQSKLDEVMAAPYDGATPAGGIPACGSAALNANACANTGGVSAFDGEVETLYGNYQRSVSVAFAGDELNLANNQAAKRVTVVATAPNGTSVTLAVYRSNF